ncbi:hypothetical protein T439DRAFT_337826, partial [Meredithblackwellia eburnea MCA 4105]
SANKNDAPAQTANVERSGMAQNHEIKLLQAKYDDLKRKEKYGDNKYWIETLTSFQVHLLVVVGYVLDWNVEDAFTSYLQYIQEGSLQSWNCLKRMLPYLDSTVWRAPFILHRPLCLKIQSHLSHLHPSSMKVWLFQDAQYFPDNRRRRPPTKADDHTPNGFQVEFYPIKVYITH